jgi:hypothetical protein
LNPQRQINIEQMHRTEVQDIVEALLRKLVPNEINMWFGSSYAEILQLGAKALQQELEDTKREED